jgi:superfamily I DNA and/or RNA helicase
MKEIYEKFKEDSHNNFDDKQEAIFKILENKINYILLKLDLLIAEKIDNLNLKTLIEKLDLTIYKEVKDILIFYKRDEHSKIDEISKLYLADIGKSTKKSLDYYFLVKYFKDETSDIDELKELYNEYKDSY